MLQPATKRKMSAAGLLDLGRTVHRRSAKACNCCRARKVRCDVVGIGIPCTNCRMNDVDCLVTECKQQRRAPDFDESILESSAAQSLEGGSRGRPPSAASNLEAPQSRFGQPSVAEDVYNGLVWEDAFPYHRFNTFNPGPGDRPGSRKRPCHTSIIDQHRPAIQTTLDSQDNPEIVLPQYLTALPQRMTARDVLFLRNEGAFIIPETPLRNELLCCYIQFVHPYLPVLDLEDFLMRIEKNDPGTTIGILLFQAVMLAGIPYVDIRLLTAHGYRTRRQAGLAFFRRARLLYDYYYEADRINVVQSLLLMTVWWDSAKSREDTWQLLGVAISLARTTGLDRDTSKSPIPEQRRRLWKRIWWSCYMKDRLVAMALRRPSRIRDVDFNVPMLKLDDFETAPLPPELDHIIGRCSAANSSVVRETLARMCIAMASCCRCITPILACQYPLLPQKAEVVPDTASWLAPTTTVPDSYEIIRCDRELEVWYTALSDDLRLYAPGSHARATNSDDDVLKIHRNVLTGTYLAASSVLHYLQIMPSSLNLETVPELQDLSMRRVRETASLTTYIYCMLSSDNLLGYLPDTGVTILLPALSIHLKDIESIDPAIRQLGDRRFHLCMRVLRQLSDTYVYAASAISYFEAALIKTGVPAGADLPGASRQASIDSRQQSASSPWRSTGTLPASPESPQVAKPSFQATQVASILMLNCTITQQERHFFAGLTPPSSDHGSPSSHSTKGGSDVLGSTEAVQAERIYQESTWAEQTMGQEEASTEETSTDPAPADSSVTIDDGIFQDPHMDWLALPTG